ncbi:hypothetical protein PIB30_070647 [Stylosanthes scabra]|uniref:Uncharacterized protein n=1 Tax=Stylosanthes scabra TaxID=79078 RepID=A0ABU6XLE1_9FABA|nr:hypothetical protein [Stylosanthes scabra]
MMPLHFRPTTGNIILKEGAMVNLLVGSHLSSHKLSLGSLIPTAQAQPTAPSPLPSQPLPNPKRDINVVQVEMDNEVEDEAENEDGENDWLYELLKELANSDDEEDEESEDESEEEDSEDEFVEKGDQTEEEAREKDRDKGKILFINTLFKEKKNEEEIPIKCEDLGP